MKRPILSILVLLCLASALCAHGSKEEDKVTIEYWTHEDANRADLEDRYASEFMQLHPGVTIEIKRYTSSKLLTLVRNAFIAGEGPTIFNLSSSDAYQFIVDGKVSPVDYRSAGYSSVQELENSYIPNVLDPCTYRGQGFGLPLEMTTAPM